METNLYNTYLFRAIEAYPWELETAVEALNYALAYEPNNVNALCLMAKVHYEQLNDYKTAVIYFERSIASNIENPSIYADYIMALVNMGDFIRAEKLIAYALRFEGTEKARIKLSQGYYFEATHAFDAAIDALNDAKSIALNNEFISYVDTVIARVVKKRNVFNKKNETKSETPVVAKKSTNGNWFRDRLNNLL